MIPYDFERSIGFWLYSTHQAYTRQVSLLLAEQGVTFRQAQVLGLIAMEGPLTQADLAERMLIEPPSLVGVLDRMEAMGLVERRTSAHDRRKKFVHPLPAADVVWERIIEVGRQMRMAAAKGLTDTELITLERLLAKVRANVALNLEPNLEPELEHASAS